MITNYAKQAVAWSLGSNISNNFISCFAIGSGSGTALATDVTLLHETGSRAMITGSPDFTTVRKVSFQGDWNSVQMSGITLFEFGLFASGASMTGSTWQRECIGSVVFDGSNELEILSTLEIL